LLDLAFGAASIINKNNRASIHHHWLPFEHRLRIAGPACGERYGQGRCSDNPFHFCFLPICAIALAINKKGQPGASPSSPNAFCVAQRNSGHGVTVRYGYHLDPALPAGAIIDENRGPVSHV
jgi:hypothetical protein